MPTLTVIQLTHYIRALFEEDFRLQDEWVTGEVSTLSRPASGHVYFTLKDGESQIKCVMWKGQARQLGRLPQQGEAVVAHGRVDIYAAAGAYQLYVDHLEAVGLGVLHAQFEALRDRLRGEGLFDRERPLPLYPQHIGVVTSAGAAAWRDVCTTLQRRWPLARVTLAPTLVQGVDAPPLICAALARLNALDDVDVILIVRGGGSMEDLWAFNDEAVARAIWDCRVPVISGVGHETDFTICDFVADHRAPTPTGAALFATPDRDDLRRQLADLTDSLDVALDSLVRDKARALEHLERHLARLSPARDIVEGQRDVAALARRARQALAHRLSLARVETAGQAARLAVLDPRATLRRGYAIVTDADTGAVIHSRRQVRSGQALRVDVADGGFDTTAGRQRRLLEE